MKNIYRLLGATLLAMCLAGCASLTSKTLAINQGDDKKDVLKIMGTPGDRQFKGEDEAWQYRHLHFNTYHFCVIWFYEGKVTGITFYSQGGNPYDYAYKQIDWETAPNYSVEWRVKHEN